MLRNGKEVDNEVSDGGVTNNRDDDVIFEFLI